MERRFIIATIQRGHTYPFMVRGNMFPLNFESRSEAVAVLHDFGNYLLERSRVITNTKNFDYENVVIIEMYLGNNMPCVMEFRGDEGCRLSTDVPEGLPSGDSPDVPGGLPSGALPKISRPEEGEEYDY